MLLGDIGSSSLSMESASWSCVHSDAQALELIGVHTRRATGGVTRPSMTLIDFTIFELKSIITDNLAELGMDLSCPCIVELCVCRRCDWLKVFVIVEVD